MKRALCFISAAFFVLTLAAAGTPKRGMVVFRFDDNKSPELWRELHTVFRKHGFNFSVAANPLWAQNPEQIKVMQEMVADGNEIMDHTPNHSHMKIIFKTAEEAKKYESHPGVESRKNNVLYLKTVFNKSYTWNKKLVISIKDNKIVSPDDTVKKHLHTQNFIVFPDGKIYGVNVKNKEYTICSAWGDPCRIADGENIEVIRSDRFGVQTSDDGLRLLAAVSVAMFEKFRLPRPECIVVAGGWGCFPHQTSLNRIYGKEFGYTCGTAVNYWFGVYDRPDPENERFAFSCEWNSPENYDLPELKKMLSDHIAKNRVVSMISHLWYNRVPGGKDELLKRNDQLLAWLKKKKIPVMTMSQAAKLLFDGNADRKYNVVPDPENDLDEDGRADGYEVVENTEFSGKSISRKSPGTLFMIKKLSGVSAGKNTISCKVYADPGTKLTLKTAVYKKNFPALERKLPVMEKFVKSSGEVVSFDLNIPKSSPAVDIELSTSGATRIMSVKMIAE